MKKTIFVLALLAITACTTASPSAEDNGPGYVAIEVPCKVRQLIPDDSRYGWYPKAYVCMDGTVMMSKKDVH